MATLTPPAAPEPATKAPDLHAFEHHWQDEADAAYLYGVLAESESDPAKKATYLKLAEVERRHLEIWAGLLEQYGRKVGAHRPTARTRLLAFIGRRIGPNFLLPMLLAEEGREVKAYLTMHRETAGGVAGKSEALTLARESAEHATTLNQVAGRSGEPWHRTGAGGFLRNVVYGFNDGLTANFGLVAGVIGASATNANYHAVIVAGVAGLIADALSMGSSGYLAAQSEREVYAHEIAMERDEVALMPEIERDELALIYELKGIDPDHARQLATQMMGDPEQMLAEMVQEELGISESETSPFREAWITGTATAIGAVIPVAPFFFLEGHTAAIVSFAVSMVSHWGVGAARSVFTGRSVFRSGLDMFVVGLGVAVVGYYVGEWIGKLL
jgi:VIT1/CCC1 family predicted Fe2+/Mn2+ transporter